MILEALKDGGSDLYRRTRDGIEAGLSGRRGRAILVASGVGIALGLVAVFAWRRWRTVASAPHPRRRTAPAPRSVKV